MTTRGQGRATWSERLVRRASGALEKRVSRRSFISRTTMLGSAVAAGGTTVITRPVSAYAAILACPGGSLCNDGYTEFCCVINGGRNACPSGTVPAGWWRADFTYFCGGGPRYYIDCNTWGAASCGCALGDCNRRKVYCNRFRYGQCHQEIPGTGTIACRMVLCEPPYVVPGLGCSPSGAVDNSTAGHITDCLIPSAKPPPPAPPPPPARVLPSAASVVSPAAGLLSAFVRASDSTVRYRDFDGTTWGPWQNLGGGHTSSIIAVVRDNDTWVFSRGNAHELQYKKRTGVGGSWSAWHSLGGQLTADPGVVLHKNTLWVFQRSSNHRLYYRVLLQSGWAGWFALGGDVWSDPMPVSHSSGLYVFYKARDGSLRYRRRQSGWGPTKTLRGVLASDPAPVAAGGALYVFYRGTDKALWYRRSNGSAWSPEIRLGGQALTSDPIAVNHGGAVWVFARAGNSRTLIHRRFQNGSWSGWGSLQGLLTADPAVTSAGDLFAFYRAADAQIRWRRYDGSSWTGWTSLGGLVLPVRAWD